MALELAPAFTSIKSHLSRAQDYFALGRVSGSLPKLCKVWCTRSVVGLQTTPFFGNQSAITRNKQSSEDFLDIHLFHHDCRKPGQALAAAVGTGASAVQDRNASQNGMLLTALLANDVKEKEHSPDLLGESLRMGGLIDDGKVYREKFVIRCYEVGTNRTASMETMANLLQEVGCNHAQSVGFSTDGFATTTKMRERHLIWVTTRMHIEICEYPIWGQVVEIDTWFQTEGKVGTRRDWVIRKENGEVIGRATSMWVMMNEDTRRLSRISDDVKEEYIVFCPQPARYAFPGEENSSTKKISVLDDPAEYFRSGLMPRRSDLDMNQHVNNVTYIGWMLESMPKHILDGYELILLTLDYRRECRNDDTVESLTSPEEEILEPSEGNGAAIRRVETSVVEKENGREQFLHLVRLVGSGKEINRGRTEWRKKKCTV